MEESNPPDNRITAFIGVLNLGFQIAKYYDYCLWTDESDRSSDYDLNSQRSFSQLECPKNSLAKFASVTENYVKIIKLHH